MDCKLAALTNGLVSIVENRATHSLSCPRVHWRFVVNAALAASRWRSCTLMKALSSSALAPVSGWHALEGAKWTP